MPRSRSPIHLNSGGGTALPMALYFCFSEPLSGKVQLLSKPWRRAASRKENRRRGESEVQVHTSVVTFFSDGLIGCKGM